MFNLFNTKKPAFGLDISGNSFKLMELGKKGANQSVLAYSDVSLPKAVIVNDTITDVKSFGYLLRQSMDKCHFGKLDTNYAVVSLPESKSFVRVIQIPKMSESEAESAVPVEAESFIPLPVDQVYMDWQKIGETGDKMNILIIASPREFVDSYLSTLESSGIKVAVLEVESQSCLRAVLPPGGKETVLVVDLDAFRSSLIMAEDGNLQFTSTVPIAGNSFTDAVAKILGVANSKAEEIKRKIGIANTANYPNIKIALLPVLNNLCAEIKSILRFHSEHSDRQVGRIILTGGSARLKNLPDFLAPQFADFPGLKLELANPWQSLPQLKQPPLDVYDSLSFTTAIGLAMRGMDFEP
jgi:type IV pilus assembly protein PilM